MTKRPFVFIVEDDEWLAEQYIRTLGAAGFVARYTTDPRQAMSLIDTEIPDALFVDVLLPGGNIFPLIHELRSHADLAAIPIIICTNIAEQLVAEDVAAYGVSAVLDKATMKPEDVAAAVKKVLL